MSRPDSGAHTRRMFDLSIFIKELGSRSFVESHFYDLSLFLCPFFVGLVTEFAEFEQKAAR